MDEEDSKVLGSGELSSMCTRWLRFLLTCPDGVLMKYERGVCAGDATEPGTICFPVLTSTGVSSGRGDWDRTLCRLS